MTEKRGRRRNSASAAIYIPVAVLIIIFIWIFGTSVFFKVSAIEVSGAVRYSEKEIVGAAGIAIGDNLLLIDVNAAVIKLRSELPYLEDIQIQRSYPDKIVIGIKESSAAAVVSAQGSEWVIDSAGRILEKSSAKPAGLIRVVGITPSEPAVGQLIVVSEDDMSRFECMKTVIKAVGDSGLQGSVSIIDVTSISNVTITYKTRFTVALGSADNLRYKFDTMLDVISKLPDSAGAVGTILLSSDNPRFIPAQ